MYCCAVTFPWECFAETLPCVSGSAGDGIALRQKRAFLRTTRSITVRDYWVSKPPSVLQIPIFVHRVLYSGIRDPGYPQYYGYRRAFCLLLVPERIDIWRGRPSTTISSASSHPLYFKGRGHFDSRECNSIRGAFR